MSRLAAVYVPASLRAALVAEARQARPDECCGLLIGTKNRVQFAAATTNMARRGRYRVDPAAHIELRRTLRRFSPPLSIVGAYHSHAHGPAMPSPTDLAEALYPAWTHLIIGLGERAQRRATVRAFRLANARAVEQSIRWYRLAQGVDE